MAEDLIDTSSFARKIRLRRWHDRFCHRLTAEVRVADLPAAVLKRLEAAGCGPRLEPDEFIDFGEPVCRDHYVALQWDGDGYCVGGSGAYALPPVVNAGDVIAKLRARAEVVRAEAEAARIKAEELAERDRLALAKTERLRREEDEKAEAERLKIPEYRMRVLEERISRLEKPVNRP
jgi:hypothetical protein